MIVHSHMTADARIAHLESAMAEHGREIRALDQKAEREIRALDQKVDEMGRKVDSVESKVDSLDTKLNALISMMGTLSGVYQGQPMRA